MDLAERRARGKSLADLLDEFESLRTENLQTLRDWHLDEQMLSLEGEHPAFGTVTLKQLLATWAAVATHASSP